MPYRVDPKNNKCVQVKIKDKWQREGCTKGPVKNYLAALHANVNESEEFDWVPKEVDLNDHRVLYLIIEDTLKNSNFKIVKEGDVYHIEDEYGDIYFYISERDFNMPFIYHEIKDNIHFLKYENDNEMLSYYEKLMSLLSPLYKNNLDILFKRINESEDLDWVNGVLEDGINIGDFYKVNLEYPIVAKVTDIIFDDVKVFGDYVVKIKYFNEDEEEEWGPEDTINIDWMYHLINDDKHWIKVTKEYVEELFKDYKYFKSTMGQESKNLNESEWFEDVVNEPIMLKVEELEVGDIVIPTCFVPKEFIVIGKGTSVKLLHEPTHWVTLKRNTKENTGGVYFEHDTETGRNCRFKLIHRENDIIEESEEFNWVEDILSTSPLTFGGKEIMIDVSDLDDNEKVKLLDILEPHIDRDLDGSNSGGDWGWDCLIKNKKTKSLSLHCGIEDNEFEPQKGRVCCLTYKFGDEKEQNPESIIPVRGKDLLGLDRNQQTNMNESEEEEFNWAEDIIANTTEEIDISNDFDLWKNKLVEGSVVKITGGWENIEFEDDIATIVNLPTETESYLLKFDRVMYEFGNTNEGYHTHCGENETQNIKCECQRKRNNQDEVGKCWWTNLRYVGKVIYLPFEGKQITESEEDSELFWAEDLLKGLTDSVDITDKLDIMEELPVGSILQVKGHQDEMELDMHEVKLIDKAKDHSFESTYYLFKLKHEKISDNHEMTHCGSGQRNRGTCECRPATNDDDTIDGEVGKCWWIELKRQDNVVYYPNRIDLSENKIEKTLLTEGRYDAITRKVVRDIMKVVNGSRIGDFILPSDVSNEQDYEQEGLSFNLELDIIETEDIEKFEVRTAIADEDDENIMLMTIILGPKFNKQNLEALFYKLQEDVRHEIEHFTQMGPDRIEDRPIYKGNTANFKTVYGHHKNIIEIPALVRGFYRRAKIERKPIDEIMMDDLDTEIERGNLSKNTAQKLLTIWVDYAKKYLPHAIYRKD